MALKTALKPDATIPILWAILTTRALLLCSTHATRTVWREIPLIDLNTIRATADGRTLQVIAVDLHTPDLFLPMPPDQPVRWAEEFLALFSDLQSASAR